MPDPTPEEFRSAADDRARAQSDAHDLAMRRLAALSFDPDSMDRESEVDIWGFHDGAPTATQG